MVILVHPMFVWSGYFISVMSYVLIIIVKIESFFDMIRKYDKTEDCFRCYVYMNDANTPLCMFSADFKIRLAIYTVNYGTTALVLLSELSRFISRLQTYLNNVATLESLRPDGRLYGAEDFVLTDELFDSDELFG